MIDSTQSSATLAFRAARDFLLSRREDYEAAYRDFRWPRLRRVQLRGRLVRRARGHPACDRRSAGDRGGRLRAGADVRRALDPVPAARRVPRRGRGQARRPGPAPARQLRAPVGIDAGLHPDGCGDDPGHHPAVGGRPARPARPRQRRCSDRRRRRHVEVRVRHRRARPAVSVGASDGWLSYDDAVADGRELLSAVARSPTRRCCSTSPRVRPRSPSSSSTPTRRTRSGT